MRAFKPIKKPIARSYFIAKFRYEYMAKVPKYDAESGTLVTGDVREGPVEYEARALAADEYDAWKLMEAALKKGFTHVDRKGVESFRVPIEGTLEGVAVREWEPKRDDRMAARSGSNVWERELEPA